MSEFLVSIPNRNPGKIAVEVQHVGARGILVDPEQDRLLSAPKPLILSERSSDALHHFHFYNSDQPRVLQLIGELIAFGIEEGLRLAAHSSEASV